MASGRAFRWVGSSRAVFTAAILVAGWPVIFWYARRMTDLSDEPVGLLGLGLALFYARRKGWDKPLEQSPAWIATAALAVYCGALFVEAPPLLRGMIWVFALGFAAAPKGKEFAWFVALFLSLPFAPTLQFYLGYPLRWLVTNCAGCFLSLFGPRVLVEGVSLNLHGVRVLIDAPCAGIQMGWTLSFLATVLALGNSLGARGTLRLLRTAGLLGLLANFTRVCALFVVETHLAAPSENLHDIVGLVCFAGAAYCLLFISRMRTTATGFTGAVRLNRESGA